MRTSDGDLADRERIEVGDLAFDPASGEMSGPGGVGRLAPQPASLLALLATRAGEVVTRDEVREHLWPEGKVEFEQGIAFAVREIRKVIEGVGGDPGVLETIPKRGFRLHGARRRAGRDAGHPADPFGSATPGEATAATAPTVATAPTAPAAPVPHRRRPPTHLALGGALLAAVVIVLLRAGSARTPVLAVFAHDAGDDPASVEVAAALATELTTVLTGAFEERLGVVGPTATSAIGDPNDTESARVELGACLILSGGVRAVGTDSVVVFTQIVRADDRVHVWAVQDTVAVAGGGAAAVPTIVRGVESVLADC